MTLCSRRQYFSPPAEKMFAGHCISPHSRHLQISHTFVLCCVSVSRSLNFTNTAKMSKPFDPEQAENLEDVRCTP